MVPPSPRALSEFAVLWREHLRRIAVRQTDVLLLLLYAFAVVPTALVARLVGHRFLPPGPPRESATWWPRRASPRSLRDLRRMY